MRGDGELLGESSRAATAGRSERPAEPSRRPGWPPARRHALSTLAGLLVWYPAAGWPGSRFWGLGGVLPPTRLVYGYVLLLGAGAAATAASLVVEQWWARLAVLLVTGLAAAHLLVPEVADTDLPHERTLLLGLLLAGQAAGFVVGSVLRRHRVGWALGLALVAALQPTDGYAVWLAPLALVLCGLLVRRRSAASVLAALAGAVTTAVVFLGVRAAAFALGYGWGAVRRGSGFPRSPTEALRRVIEPMADFLRSEATGYLGTLLTVHRSAVVVGVLGLALVAFLRWRGVAPRRPAATPTRDGA